MASYRCPRNPEKASRVGTQEAKSRQTKEATRGMLVFVLRASGPERLKQGGSQSRLHL